MSIIIRLVAIALCIVAFGTFAMYSHKIIDTFVTSREFIDKWYYKHWGKILKRVHVVFTRNANLNKNSLSFKIYSFYSEIIVNLDMAKDNVTVVGLLTFIASVSVAIALVTGVLLNSVSLIPLIIIAIFYLITVLFRFSGLMNYEEIESEVMDAVDLLVSDINGGIYNAVLRYKDSFHPNIRPHFYEFIDNIQNKGFSFTQAMMVLNGKLGRNFDDFALKAVLFEDKADDTMDDIFSAMVEKNRQRRTLRYINNIKFKELRTQFIISFLLILGYAVFSMLFDDFIYRFITETEFGKCLILFDIVLVAFVLSYLATIKAKSL